MQEPKRGDVQFCCRLSVWRVVYACLGGVRGVEVRKTQNQSKIQRNNHARPTRHPQTQSPNPHETVQTPAQNPRETNRNHKINATPITAHTRAAPALATQAGFEPTAPAAPLTNQMGERHKMDARYAPSRPQTPPQPRRTEVANSDKIQLDI